MMREQLATAASYTLVVLRRTDRYGMDGTERIIWKHGRRTMGLQADGVMPIACPVGDDDDPAVRASILSYSVHVCRGFPGAMLPTR